MVSVLSVQRDGGIVLVSSGLNRRQWRAPVVVAASVLVVAACTVAFIAATANIGVSVSGDVTALLSSCSQQSPTTTTLQMLSSNVGAFTDAAMLGTAENKAHVSQGTPLKGTAKPIVVHVSRGKQKAAKAAKAAPTTVSEVVRNTIVKINPRSHIPEFSHPKVKKLANQKTKLNDPWLINNDLLPHHEKDPYRINGQSQVRTSITSVEEPAALENYLKSIGKPAETSSLGDQESASAAKAKAKAKAAKAAAAATAAANKAIKAKLAKARAAKKHAQAQGKAASSSGAKAVAASSKPTAKPKHKWHRSSVTEAEKKAKMAAAHKAKLAKELAAAKAKTAAEAKVVKEVAKSAIKTVVAASKAAANVKAKAKAVAAQAHESKKSKAHVKTAQAAAKAVTKKMGAVVDDIHAITQAAASHTSDLTTQVGDLTDEVKKLKAAKLQAEHAEMALTNKLVTKLKSKLIGQIKSDVEQEVNKVGQGVDSSIDDEDVEKDTP